jgi:hypothetical protein
MHIQNVREAIKSYVLYTLILTSFVAPLTYAVSAYAVLYPSWGFYKMSLNKAVDRGQIGMASTRAYDADLVTAYSNVKTSTTGYTEMPSTVWPNGYNMVQNNWTGTWNNYVDIKIQWTDRTGDSVGITNSNLEPSSWCTFWGQSTPCGVYSTISLDITRWANYGAGALRQRVVEHETGHAVGMPDYCGGDAIMNDGSAGCNSGRWTAVMSYTSHDRTTTNSVYR